MTATQGAGRSGEQTAADGETASAPAVPQQASEADTQQMAPLTGKVAAPPDNARQLEAEIERTREQLGETVQELVARVDVKSRAQAKAAEVSGQLKSTAAQIRGDAAARTRGVRENWIPLAVAAGLLTIGALALSQWKRRISAS